MSWDRKSRDDVAHAHLRLCQAVTRMGELVASQEDLQPGQVRELMLEIEAAAGYGAMAASWADDDEAAAA